jgi:hypothetical protein
VGLRASNAREIVRWGPFKGPSLMNTAQEVSVLSITSYNTNFDSRFTKKVGGLGWLAIKNRDCPISANYYIRLCGLKQMGSAVKGGGRNVDDQRQDVLSRAINRNMVVLETSQAFYTYK